MRCARSAFSVGNISRLALVVAIGCGGDATRNVFDDAQQKAANDPAPDQPASGSFGDAPSSNVVLDPKNATVIIDTATTPATAGSVVYKVLKDGQDLAGAQFSLRDPSLGTFNGKTFTSAGQLPTGVLGKSTIVTAQTSGGQALGTLTVVQLRKTGLQRDFFFVVPYEDNPTPKSDVLAFSTNIKQADVAFVMDTTGSMTSSITALKTALQGSLLAQLQAAIPNVGLAIVDFKDFPNGGAADPYVVQVRQTVTTTLALAQSAVGAMTASGGGDGPEASIAAMEYTLLGQANGTIPVHVNTAPGTFGGVDLRSGSVPIVVNVTDADWHDPSGTATMASLKTAFASTKAKFVAVTEGAGLSTTETQADDLSDATGSNVPSSAFGSVLGCGPGQCCTGLNGAGRVPTAPGGTCRLNFLSSGGSGVSGGIVSAIQAIAVGSSFDVKAVPSNDPQNPNGVDATKFIQALRAMAEGNPAAGCPAAEAKDSDGDGIKDTFVAVRAGTPVCFEIIAAKNTIVPPELDPQFFNAFVDVIAVQGDLHLDKRTVLFLVPPKDAGVK